MLLTKNPKYNYMQYKQRGTSIWTLVYLPYTSMFWLFWLCVYFVYLSVHKKPFELFTSMTFPSKYCRLHFSSFERCLRLQQFWKLSVVMVSFLARKHYICAEILSINGKAWKANWIEQVSLFETAKALNAIPQ